MTEKLTAEPSNRPIWTGNLTIGLINLPLKLFPMIYDKVPQKALEIDAFLRVRGKVEERDGNLNMIVDEIKLGDLVKVQSSAEIFTEKKEENE